MEICDLRFDYTAAAILLHLPATPQTTQAQISVDYHWCALSGWLRSAQMYTKQASSASHDVHPGTGIKNNKITKM